MQVNAHSQFGSYPVTLHLWPFTFSTENYLLVFALWEALWHVANTWPAMPM